MYLLIGGKLQTHIFVVSHGHGDVISRIDCLSKLQKSGLFQIHVKNNCNDELLENYCNAYGINLIDSNYGLGFGHNNNYLYNYLKCNNRIKINDFVVIMNPDVDVNVSILSELIYVMVNDNIYLATLNLFKDSAFTEYDNSIRSWPTLLSFLQSFLGYNNPTVIDKSVIFTPTYVDWAAGSFLVFRASLFADLNGFDEQYFMYCEDIDICYRASVLGHKLKYYPFLKAVHMAAHKNRKLFSKHFFWHVMSAFRFLFKTKCVKKNRNCM